MLQGKQYARGIRGIKLVHEALFHNFFAGMESWMGKEEKSLESPGREQKLQELQAALDAKDLKEAMQTAQELEQDHLSTVQEAIEDFQKVGREQSETFAFWNNFLYGSDILLHLLRAEREANFELHLIATCEAIPWFTAAGRSTYAKFVPVYVADMKALEQAQPESYRHMCNSGFTVRRSENHKFNCIAANQALQQTVNKDGKSKGGVIGLTL